MNNIRVFIVFFNLFLLIFAYQVLKFTNVACKNLDPSFGTFKKCELKMVNRGVPALNIHIKMFKLPINNLTINLELMKKANGYRPFLYNITTEFCNFMKNRKRFPFLKIFFDHILKESNVNHTCPYNHDIIVSNMILQKTLYLPLPDGSYLFKVTLGCYNEWKSEIKVYILNELL